jgi:ribonuclease VapC
MPSRVRGTGVSPRELAGGSGHKAGLNFGDCFAYALAKTAGEALLFKGNDFGHTDVTPALPTAPDSRAG